MGRSKGVSEDTQVVGEQAGKAVFAKPDVHEALNDIEVGIAIALHDDRTVVENRNVPAHDHSVVELAMCLRRNPLRLAPAGQGARFDR